MKKVVIKISDALYQECVNQDNKSIELLAELKSSIANGILLETDRNYVCREEVEDNIFRIMCDSRYYDKFRDSIEDSHAMARAIVRMLYSMQGVPSELKEE